jgi:hypothetical protein
MAGENSTLINAGSDPGEPNALVEVARGQQRGVTGEPAWPRLGDERSAEGTQDLWPGGCYNP